MKKRTKLKTALLLAMAVNSSYAEEKCFPPTENRETLVEVLTCFQSEIGKLKAENQAQQKLIQAQQDEIQALKLRLSLNDGLVAHYPFDGNADDVSGHGHHGIEHGGLSYVPGLIGQAASFDGVNDYIEIPDVRDFVFANDSVTFSAWVQIVDNYVDVYRPFISMDNKKESLHLAKSRGGWSEGRIYWEFIPNDKETIIFSKDNGDALPKSQWIHLVGSIYYETKRISLYVDGILQQEAEISNIDMSSSEQLVVKIGAFTHVPGMHKGFIDDVRLYRRHLSELEIQLLSERKE